MKRFLHTFIFLFVAWAANAQTPMDGLMMPSKSLCTGFMYTYDQWREYWEGTLKRDNLNIGTLTTQSVMWYGVYGLNKKVNLMGMVPYVWTNASMGTTTGLKGLQDLSLSAKYNFYTIGNDAGKFNAFAVGSFSTPLSDYTPDFLPFSIGMASTNLSGRLTANYTMAKGWYINASGAYTWRSNVTLDRPAYYTDGNSFSTDEVKMPNVFDFIVDVGYHKGPLQAEFFYTQMNTLGGGDIRRQDMPFVSNRMNFSKVGALVMYYLAKPKGVGLRASVSQTVAGRNVGQTTSLLAGILYTINFDKKETTTSNP